MNYPRFGPRGAERAPHRRLKGGSLKIGRIGEVGGDEIGAETSKESNEPKEFKIGPVEFCGGSLIRIST
ncbi:unnamed protein product [Nesidiocoris tenuis]|uniref:Uncharacterized protein n=1 Tax=Nesidiocoris tenuis TaxID=355587 RepID=A0A6H5HNQ5_9HEMI|nr:unnamed protein product [Nesidiocoris tenuis]